MRYLLALFLSFPLLAQPLRQGYSNCSERIHHTLIHANLNTETHVVKATMTLKWRNTTGKELLSIPFHLYLNAFSHLDTVFMTESGGQLRGDSRASDDIDGFGYCQVFEITDGEGNSLMANWKVERDTALLELPTPLLDGEELHLHMSFESKLPIVFARSGYSGTFHLIGQWFPKPGVYFQDTWKCANYHAHSEFFADFGTYDAYLTVPSEYIVGATGALAGETKGKDPQTGNETITYYYQAEDVHDFAWTADSEFGSRSTDFEGINIRLLYQMGQSEEGIENQFEAARATFSWFRDHVGPYPFSTMTIIQPPMGGAGAAGMEYPTLVTAIPYLDPQPFAEIGAMVTIHEIGHNYWQGMLASNEFEESWMDEGINSYTEARILTESYGSELFLKLFPGFGITSNMYQRLGYLSGPDLDPMVRKSWNFINSSSYGINSYSRPATTLLTAQNLFGMEMLDRLLSEYYQQWSFRHPTTVDFLEVAEEISPDLEQFLRANLYGTDTVDLMVKRLRSRKEQSGGFSMDSQGQVGEFVDVERKEVFTHQVTLFRKGDFVPPPIDVLLAYDDGSKEVRAWDLSQGRWVKWKWEGDARLTYVQIDPEYKLLMDLDFTNNIKNNSVDDDWRVEKTITTTMHLVMNLIFPF